MRGVDYFVAETFSWGAEALMALAAIRKYSKVPAVITMAMHREDVTREGWTRRRCAGDWRRPGLTWWDLTATAGPPPSCP